MIAMPWRPRSPLSRIASPGRDAGGRNFNPRRDPADASGVDEDAVALAAIDHLGVAGYDPHAGRSGGLGHRRDHAAERFHRQALFEDEACAEIRRPGSGHRQVVDGPVDGQFADVAAGEEQGVDDVAVGGEGQAARLGGQHRAVVRWRGKRGERREERGEGGRDALTLTLSRRERGFRTRQRQARKALR